MAETIANIDKWGIDPLSVSVFDDVDRSLFTTKRIDASMEGNPQLLSYKELSTNAYWRNILIANGWVHSSEMLAGALVAIPQPRPSAAIKQVKRTQI
ncbi:hypothetical protein pEaSNUABM14_00134 [Erwinia phage pEa_SNUABM_14]|uniref:Uncharacterized protein n=1 Tax=Erwinia phage pEa_SNUABM_7 TaxID=2866695 RepID=A0AAE7WS94_9CAUD|nr:tail sheath [Erwinia phage pEa_SNUABM_7]QYW03094.1 hypothetical protein pEaSNUABM13_00135 [Erwinia phage pEa_SNUABM_13]QYW03435.1 hypothetical protein pEaSNUABM34_00133 [Erwinia phage pEa_SNUABM_34]QYW03777.1 hypothetical protein pEaSNUABM45_00134 [Erwinia phage pEa_SNUABM_45]QYW04459.1 hypothetical protein pEaSNUABM14_00134 [Erwinia phage pEa_SNUABM_14]QYW05148.1 hypothetical protein pEaSNUABM21_00134 [Erwinia phage pEa_SNUABM_21]